MPSGAAVNERLKVLLTGLSEQMVDRSRVERFLGLIAQVPQLPCRQQGRCPENFALAELAPRWGSVRTRWRNYF